jgi:hypothetical protein
MWLPIVTFVIHWKSECIFALKASLMLMALVGIIKAPM